MKEWFKRNGILASLIVVAFSGICASIIKNEIENATQQEVINDLKENVRNKADQKTVDETYDNIQSGLVSINENINKLGNSVNEMTEEQKHINIKLNVVSKYVKGAKEEIEKLNDIGVFNKAEKISMIPETTIDTIRIEELKKLDSIEDIKPKTTFDLLKTYSHLFGVQRIF